MDRVRQITALALLMALSGLPALGAAVCLCGTVCAGYGQHAAQPAAAQGDAYACCPAAPVTEPRCCGTKDGPVPPASVHGDSAAVCGCALVAPVLLPVSTPVAFQPGCVQATLATSNQWLADGAAPCGQAVAAPVRSCTVPAFVVHCSFLR